ncbi:hypothetical protein [Streptomyces albipurpureus]|uniref:Pentapeptide repeat-containing protein n=1 Tax=Streptomyces albipurpureus TaxID=2897419 RepID=A0ABT0UHB5_9ACTN|nr:hypothetical protein [Streptomyces sp. CWNU-1]MCM2388042.1 hypothetical protein [Streptomyces sp. CWNU-1]
MPPAALPCFQLHGAGRTRSVRSGPRTRPGGAVDCRPRPHPAALHDTRDLGTRDLGTRDLGTRDLGTRDLGTRHLSTRDLGTRHLSARDPSTSVLWQNCPTHPLRGLPVDHVGGHRGP